ncbi:hypothetical protein P0D94_20135 [Pseudomonas sp. CBSPCGW29]|nr:hypothetical protein P0D94_20135 [Pseudomonas sp. CBSPCGW29]
MSVLVLAPHAQARLIENETYTIGHGEHIDSFELRNATLNVNSTFTRDVYADASTLNVTDRSTLLGTVVAQRGSSVNVANSRVTASGALNNGISLFSSNALIQGV